MFADTELLNITSRRELCFEEKINLFKEKDGGLSHHELGDRFHISVGMVSNILKRELEYANDYEANQNKKLKGKLINSEDLPGEDPPSLAESLELVRRRRILSTTQQPELHLFIIQLQSKLTDVLLDSNSSKQKIYLRLFQTCTCCTNFKSLHLKN